MDRRDNDPAGLWVGPCICGPATLYKPAATRTSGAPRPTRPAALGDAAIADTPREHCREKTGARSRARRGPRLPRGGTRARSRRPVTAEDGSPRTEPGPSADRNPDGCGDEAPADGLTWGLCSFSTPATISSAR